MLDLILLARHQYFPSGKFDLPRFFAGSIILFLSSFLCGSAAGLVYSQIVFVPILSYLSAVVPIVVGFLLGWFVTKFVCFSHCRNPWLAGVVGAACGVATILSAFHIEGTATTLRNDEQTNFFAAATRIDQIQRAIFRRVFGPGINGNAHSGFNFAQSVFLTLEVGLLIWVPIKVGRNFARRAYGESIDRWLDRSVIRTIPGSGEKIISLLESGEYLVQTLSSLPNYSTDRKTTIPGGGRHLSYQATSDIVGTWLVLEVSSFPAANGAYEAYLSATEIETNGKKRPLFQQLKLRSHEIATARKLFLEPSADWQSREAVLQKDQMEAIPASAHVRVNANTSAFRGI